MDRNLQELLRMQQVKECDWNNVEAALRGQVEQLKKKISYMDRDREIVTRNISKTNLFDSHFFFCYVEYSCVILRIYCVA